MNIHGARVQISHRFLLGLLKLEGGKIRGVFNEERCFDILSIQVEHSSLPEVKEYAEIPNYYPVFHATTPDKDKWITRVDPRLTFWEKFVEVAKFAKWLFTQYR
jgi:hypothetical protein